MMTKKYTRLTYDERIEIYKLLALKQSLSLIARTQWQKQIESKSGSPKLCPGEAPKEVVT